MGKKWVGAFCLAWVVFQGMMVYGEDRKDLEWHGNCIVGTSIDDFTDNTRHWMACSNSLSKVDRYTASIFEIILKRSAMIVFTQENDTTLVMLKTAGYTFHRGSSIPIVWRVDKGTVKRSEWKWEGDMAVNPYSGVLKMMLNELRSGNRVVFRVGDKKGNILLEGVTAAVDNFRERISKSTN